jgi:hypothetical protein
MGKERNINIEGSNSIFDRAKFMDDGMKKRYFEMRLNANLWKI